MSSARHAFRTATVLCGFFLSLFTAPTAGGITFQEVAAQRGIGAFEGEFGFGTGVAAADFDDDGDVDLFVPTKSGIPNQLYRNLGDGNFEEIAASVGLDSTESARVALWFDYDGDEDLDLLIANDIQSTPSVYRLYRQGPGGMFTDVTADAGLTIAHSTDISQSPHRGGMCAGDLDNDGYLDLFLAAWDWRPHLLMNDRNGKFIDTTVSSGIGTAERHGHQPIMMDFNGDGYLDIYAAIDFAENHLWINQGDGTFEDMAGDAGLDNAMNDMGVAVSDCDNDGDLDIHVTNIFRLGFHNVLLRNDSGGSVQFTEMANDAGVADGGWGWGTTFLDADKDGYLDLAATNGYFAGSGFESDASRFFENQLGLTGMLEFIDTADTVGFNDTEYGSCLIALDYDRDGDLDLLQVCNPSPLRLLENQGSPEPSEQYNYLVVRPRMPGTRNYRAIGAVVRAQAGGLSMTRLITAGTSYLGQEPAEAFFGLGMATNVDSVTVEWPNGSVTTVENIAPNQLIELTPPALEVVPTVSEIGAVAMAVLILLGGSLLARRSTAGSSA